MLSKQTAYEKWLGIKDQQQPPTLYRLLGVEAFESDADIISNSADSRMGYLRQFQVGDNAKVAEEILNEVSHARVVLLNADKKAAYDARLRQRMAPQAKAAGSTTPLPPAEAMAAPMRPVQTSAASPVLDLDALTSEARSTNPASHRRPKTKSNSLVWVAAAASVAVVIAAIVVVNSLSGGDDSSTNDKSKTVAVKPETPKAPVHPVAPEPSISPKPSKVEPEHPVAPPVEPPTPTPTPPPVAVATSDHAPPDSEKPAPSPPAEPPKAPDITAPAPTEAALIPVPDANAQAAATKLVKEVYGKEWAAAKTVDQKQALAKTVLEKAMESEKDRVAQFVLFRLSKEIAEQASDCQATSEAIEQIGKVFQIDALDMILDSSKKCATAATTLDQHASVAEKVAESSETAIANQNIAAAKSLIDLAVGEAKKAKDETLVKRLTERKAEIGVMAEYRPAAEKAMTALQKTPLDPESNLTVGEYECLFEGDWKAGLPKLALGGDAVLKSLAESELNVVQSASGQSTLGDRWWEAGEKQGGVLGKLMRRRAKYWYELALPQLSGFAKDRAEKRTQDGPVDSGTQKERWISKNATYVAPNSGKSEPPLPSLLTESDSLYKAGDGTEFAFQTSGTGAFITIDLHKPMTITRVYIQNRQVQERNKGLMVFFSLTPNQKGAQVWVAEQDLPEWTIALDHPTRARYITISLNDKKTDDTWFCLRKVKVYGW